MMTVVMPARHPVSAFFSIAGYRDVDASYDKAAYFAFLDSFADTFRQMTESAVDLLRLAQGNSVLDVGCGHGVSAPLLARHVGKLGRVVGIDSSQAMIAEAQRRFESSDLPVEFRIGDASALPFHDASFDAARSDRVFMFLHDPRKALSELVRVVKPGGRIVITEGDLGTHSIDASDVSTTRTVLTALADRAPNGWIGRRLRAMFVGAGLHNIDLQLIPILSTSFTEWNQRLGVDQFLLNPFAHESAERDSVTAWLNELRTRDAQDLFTATALLYMVAGQRPASVVHPQN